MNTTHVFIAITACLVLLSAFGVVYSKHQSRQLYIELKGLETERDHMDVQWGQLQLEQSTLLANGRVERLARQKLKMRIPDEDSVVMVR